MKQYRRAFSLVEVLIVLAIIALVASLVVPVVNGNRDKAAYEVSVINLKSVAKAMERHYLEKGAYPVFNSWEEAAGGQSPLLEYIDRVPATDEWGRPYKVETSTETEYKIQGFSAQGKLAEEYPDYYILTGGKLKKKGQRN